MSGLYAENAVLLGSGRSLVGIVTRPASVALVPKPTIVILNTGIVHRVGHHRMYVTMARMFAGLGHTVLRFDFSGIGDSVPRTDGLSPLDSCVADIKEALDSLQAQYQSSRFILVGLCSGADHAILYGHRDPRVVGLVLMDPSIPPTARYYVHYVLQRLYKLRNWFSVATGRSGLVRLILRQLHHSVRPQPGSEGLTLENLPFSPYLEHCYKEAVDHGIRLLAIFTSISPRSTYRGQMVDAFPAAAFEDHLRLEFFPDSDHIFTPEKERLRLGQVIREWIGSALPSENAGLSSEQANA